MARRVALLPAVVVGLLVGCGDSAPAASNSQLPALDLVEEWRVGALDAPEHEVFGSIAGVAATASGQSWILDAQASIIRRFGPDGAFLGEVGGSGDGPGEFRQPYGIVARDEGGVAVWDPGMGRLSFFDEEGTFLRSAQIPASFFGGQVLTRDTRGHYFVRGAVFPPGGMGHGGTGSPPMPEAILVRVDDEGTVRDTLFLPPEEATSPNFVLQTSGGPIRPFPEATYHVLDGSGSVVRGHSSEYLLVRDGPDGAVDTVVHRSVDRLPVVGEERAQMEAWLARFREQRPASFEASDRIPDRKPVFHYLLGDADGRIWVRMHVDARLVDSPVDEGRDGRPPLNLREPGVFEVWEADGTPVGRLELPRPARIFEARGERVWVLEEGPVGEPQVVRYRMEPAG